MDSKDHLLALKGTSLARSIVLQASLCSDAPNATVSRLVDSYLLRNSRHSGLEAHWTRFHRIPHALLGTALSEIAAKDVRTVRGHEKFAVSEVLSLPQTFGCSRRKFN